MADLHRCTGLPTTLHGTGVGAMGNYLAAVSQGYIGQKSFVTTLNGGVVERGQFHCNLALIILMPTTAAGTEELVIYQD